MDISADILVLDNGVSEVTFVNFLGTYHFDAWAGPIAQEQARPSQGIYRRYKRTFLIPRATATPVLGDTISDDDGTWTVLRASPGPLNGPWYCETINLNLNGFLDTVITLRVPTYTSNAYGDKLMTPTAVIAMPARIQPMTERPVTVNGKKVMRQTFEIYVAYDWQPSPPNSTISDGTNEYVVEEVASRQSLEDFTVIKAFIQR